MRIYGLPKFFQPKGICNYGDDDLSEGGDGGSSIDSINSGVQAALGLSEAFATVNNSLNSNTPIAVPVYSTTSPASSSIIWLIVLAVVGFIAFKELA